MSPTRSVRESASFIPFELRDLIRLRLTAWNQRWCAAGGRRAFVASQAATHRDGRDSELNFTWQYEPYLTSHQSYCSKSTRQGSPSSKSNVMHHDLTWTE